MMHDQIAAAGYETVFDTELSAERLQAVVTSQSPQVIVFGATDSQDQQVISEAVAELHAAHPGIPIVLGGAAVGGTAPVPETAVAWAAARRIPELAIYRPIV